MDDPRYIILVALDTPARSTGIYISGGVMAAPTVGAVMEDILPYLEVTRAEEPQRITVPDLTGLTKQEAERLLKEAGLEGTFLGTEETVTGQIPSAGQTVTGAQMIVYLGQEQPADSVVPDFAGMTVAQAADAAVEAGLLLNPTGNPDLTLPLTVVYQDIPAGTAVSHGSIITVKFTDPAARD